MKWLVLPLLILVNTDGYSQETQHLSGVRLDENENMVDQTTNTIRASQLSVEIYPNPSADHVFVGAKSGASVTVYSSFGTYVGTWVAAEDNKVLLNDLPAGSYVCSIVLGDMQCVKRFVIL